MSRRRKPSFRSIRPYAIFILRDGREVLVNRAYQPIAERGLTGPAYPATSRHYDDISYWGPASPATQRWVDELVTRFLAGECIREFIADSPIKSRGRVHTVTSATAA